MHHVKSLEKAIWWDSALRVSHHVEVGTVVTFSEPTDAQYFGDGVRGDPVSPNKVDEGRAEVVDDLPVAAPRRGRRKAGDDV